MTADASGKATWPRRGRPLAVLAMLLSVWVAGRAAFWESPRFASPLERGPARPVGSAPPADKAIGRESRRAASSVAGLQPGDGQIEKDVRGAFRRSVPQNASAVASTRRVRGPTSLSGGAVSIAPTARAAKRSGTPESTASPPFAPPRAASSPKSARADRWSLDGWAFWREGSDAAPVSQGRLPIYGASQVGANLQWRARPSSPHDPRVYARAYRALVERGENELALGASARPLPRVPIRFAGEVRVTDTPFTTELRPGILVVTEFVPAKLPFDLALEAYGQGGYVGGEAATAFADGQIAVTREVARFGSGLAGPIRLSIGGGSWAGAQEGASRVDIGPTMRLDLKIGEVPARVSIDWRERIGGDAAPASGVAATLSTRF